MRGRSFGVAALTLLVSCGSKSPDAVPSPRPLRLVYTADLHSHLLGEELSIRAIDAIHGLGRQGDVATVGGAARIATLLADARADGVPTVYLDAGDLLEGTSFFPAFGGVPETRVADALRIDAMAAGNHDLEFGIDALTALRRKWATFPLLGANLPDELRGGVVEPVAIAARGGLRVAVVGLGRLPDGAPSLDACAAAVNDVVSQVRAGADLVVLLSHLGRDGDVALVPKTAGVDVVIGGHTHDVVDPPAMVFDCDAETAGERGCTSRAVPVVHPGAYGRYLGRADLVLSSDAADLSRTFSSRPSVVVDERFSLLPANAAVAEASDITALLAPYASALDAAGVNRPIAFAPEAVSRRAVANGDSALGDLVTGAMQEAAASDVAVVNTTGIREDVVPGPVTLDDLVRVLPFSDELVTLQLSGDELLRAMRGAVADSCRSSSSSPFQVAGASVRVNCGASTLSLQIGGQPLNASRRYRVAAPSFLTESGGWLAPWSSTQLSTGGSLRDAVISVIQGRLPCTGAPEHGLPCLQSQADGRISWQ